MGKEAGFSLLELIVSLTLSTIVLIGVISMATQVVRNELGVNKSGTVSAQTLVALDGVTRELEYATHYEPNLPPAAGGTVVSACLNYSSILAASSLPPGCPGSGIPCGSIDGTNNLECFYYCVKPGATAGRFDSLVRYPPAGQYNAGGVVPPPGTCGVTGSFDTIVPNNFSYLDGYSNYFFLDSPIAGIDARFIVGNSTPTTTATAGAGTVAMPVPVAYKFDTRISGAKSYQVTGE